MTVLIELIYQASSPTRRGRGPLSERLSAALVASPCGQSGSATRRGPQRTRGPYGSPTILVEGRDVLGAVPGDGGASCRLYGSGREGVPPVSAIVSALESVSAGRARSGWSRALAMLPGAGIALLPVGACPACWPAYAGLLGSLGLGFLLDSSYLLPLTGLFLVMALVALGYRAAGRRGYGPLAVGVGAATAIMIGKFALASSAILYLGLAFLIGASIWNTWPLRAARTGSCGNCAPRVSGSNEPGAAEERG